MNDFEYCRKCGFEKELFQLYTLMARSRLDEIRQDIVRLAGSDAITVGEADSPVSVKLRGLDRAMSGLRMPLSRMLKLMDQENNPGERERIHDEGAGSDRGQGAPAKSLEGGPSLGPA